MELTRHLQRTAACSIGLALTGLAAAAPASSRGTPADAPPPAALRDDAAEWFERGRSALFRGESDEAILHLQKAVRAADSGARSLYSLHLARAYRYARRAGEAEVVLHEILAASPDHVEAGQLLAEIYTGQEKWQPVLDTLEPLLEYRHDYLSHHLLAGAAYELGDYPKARRYYLESLRLNPESAEDHYQLGNIELAENRYARAAHAYERALELGAGEAVLHYKLASAYFNLRNYFGQVATVDVPSGEVGTLQGEWYLIETVPGHATRFRAAPERSALHQVARALERGMKDSVDVRMLRAHIFLGARRHEQAHALYASLEGQVPEEEQALYHYHFARSALWLDRPEEYLQHLQLAAARDPESYDSLLTDAYVEVAERRHQEGDLARAVQALEQAVSRSPATASLHLQLGDTLAEARDLPRARQQWRMVLDLEPDHPLRTELLNRIARVR